MDYYGGVCLDGLNEIPQNYKDLLHIGKNVIIKTGTILCGEGFEYDNLCHKEHQNGVQIGDNVHIGSLCTIDRGVSKDTIIGDGTKIDSHVHIKGGIRIGKNCIIRAFSNVTTDLADGTNI